MAGNVFNIPHVISAEDEQVLRAYMLKNNIDNDMEFVYYQIVHDGKRFHAFYMKNIEDSVLPIKKKTKNVNKV